MKDLTDYIDTNKKALCNQITKAFKGVEEAYIRIVNSIDKLEYIKTTKLVENVDRHLNEIRFNDELAIKLFQAIQKEKPSIQIINQALSKSKKKVDDITVNIEKITQTTSDKITQTTSDKITQTTSDKIKVINFNYNFNNIPEYLQYSNSNYLISRNFESVINNEFFIKRENKPYLKLEKLINILKEKDILVLFGPQLSGKKWIAYEIIKGVLESDQENINDKNKCYIETLVVRPELFEHIVQTFDQDDILLLLKPYLDNEIINQNLGESEALRFLNKRKAFYSALSSRFSYLVYALWIQIVCQNIFFRSGIKTKELTQSIYTKFIFDWRAVFFYLLRDKEKTGDHIFHLIPKIIWEFLNHYNLSPQQLFFYLQVEGFDNYESKYKDKTKGQEAIKVFIDELKKIGKFKPFRHNNKRWFNLIITSRYLDFDHIEDYDEIMYNKSIYKVDSISNKDLDVYIQKIKLKKIIDDTNISNFIYLKSNGNIWFIMKLLQILYLFKDGNKTDNVKTLIESNMNLWIFNDSRLKDILDDKQLFNDFTKGIINNSLINDFLHNVWEEINYHRLDNKTILKLYEQYFNYSSLVDSIKEEPIHEEPNYDDNFESVALLLSKIGLIEFRKNLKYPFIAKNEIIERFFNPKNLKALISKIK